MTVNNRALFQKKSSPVNMPSYSDTAARDTLRTVGGVAPKGIMSSSPELILAQLGQILQPKGPRTNVVPMGGPPPAGSRLPPPVPVPDIAGTGAMQRVTPRPAASMPRPAASMPMPMPQGNPMSGSLQNKPGFHDGGPIGHNHGDDALRSMQASMNTPKEPTSGGFMDKAKGFTDKAKKVFNFNPNRRYEESIPKNFNDLFKLGDNLIVNGLGGPEVRGKRKEKLDAIRKKVLEAKKNPPPREELEAAASQAAPGTPKEVLAAAEVDELLKVMVGAELSAAMASPVINRQTGAVVRESDAQRIGNAAVRASKAKLAVEMGREQNELDRQKSEAVARIQSTKGTGLKLKDQLDIFVKLFGEVAKDYGNDSDQAMVEMRRLHPTLTKTFEDFSGGNAPSTGPVNSVASPEQQEAYVIEFKKLNPETTATDEQIKLATPSDY